MLLYLAMGVNAAHTHTEHWDRLRMRGVSSSAVTLEAVGGVQGVLRNSEEHTKDTALLALQGWILMV